MDKPRFDPWTTTLYRATIKVRRGDIGNVTGKNLLEFYCHTGQLMQAPISKFIVPREQPHSLFDTVDTLVYLDRNQVWTIFTNPYDLDIIDY